MSKRQEKRFTQVKCSIPDDRENGKPSENKDTFPPTKQKSSTKTYCRAMCPRSSLCMLITAAILHSSVGSDHALRRRHLQTETDAPTTSSPTGVPSLTPTSVPTPVPMVVLEEDFEQGTNGFVYMDNVFRGARNWLYARGFARDFIRVTLGGRDDLTVENMSGAYKKDFVLANDAMVVAQFAYRVEFGSALENGEDVEVLCSVDGTLYGEEGVMNDAVAVFYGADSPTTTDWITARVPLGKHLAGEHELALGGSMSMKNGIDDEVKITIDDVVLFVDMSPTASPTSFPTTSGTVLMDDTFTTSAEGFAYMDNIFREKSPGSWMYARGSWNSPTGDLRVALGGRDDVVATNMSGGHKKSFSLTDTADVMVTFSYRVVLPSTLGDGEDVQILTSVDGILYGSDGVPDDAVAVFFGADSPTNVEIMEVTVNLGRQLPGMHEFAIGGYMSTKNETSDQVRIIFDNVVMTAFEVPTPTMVPTTAPTAAPTLLPTASPVTQIAILDDDFATKEFDLSINTFRGTTVLQYSGGWWNSNTLLLAVWLGGVDASPITGMSAGHQKTFELAAAATDVTIQFRYRVFFDSTFEEGEDTQVLCSIDGTLYGQPGVANDAVAVFNGVDSPTTGDWETAVVDVGTLSAGSHEFVLGGYLSSKNDAAERVRIFFDDVLMTGTTSTAKPTPPTVVMDDDFTTYGGYNMVVEKAFLAETSSVVGGGEQYSDAWWNGNRLFAAVLLGGVDDTLVQGMSAGHSKTFTLTGDANVMVSFEYRVIFDSSFEAGEDTEVLCSVDGTLYGVDGSDAVATYNGVDDPQTVAGWSTATVDLGTLSGGDHEFVFGGYLSQKNDIAKRVRMFFDDVYMTAT